MNLPTLHTLKAELRRNGQTIGLSVAISLLLVWISSPGIIFLIAIAAIVVAYFLGDFRGLDGHAAPHHQTNGYAPYDEDEFEPHHHGG